MDLHNYKLVGHTPVPCESTEEWAIWYESTFQKGFSDRIVKRSILGRVWVSTVFLSIDHRFGEGPPLLFETMIFGLPESHPLCMYQDRCSTWEEAEAMHQKALLELKQTIRLRLKRKARRSTGKRLGQRAA